MDLSIIIPVCNVEQYVGACLESVYRQGLRDEEFEVIVVNDGSTDRSMEAVEGVMRYHPNIQVIGQQNAGPSVSRNNGMERARGEYVLFVDSDDLLTDSVLPGLLQMAFQTGADMMVPGWKMQSDPSPGASPERGGAAKVKADKAGQDYYVEDYDPRAGSFIWRILYRRAFLQAAGVRFLPGVYYEDIPFLQECLLKARRVIGVDVTAYIYRLRPRSCTFSFTMKNAMDYNTAIARTWELRRMPGLTERVGRQVENNIYYLFSYAMDCVVGVFSDRRERKMIVSDLASRVPDLSFGSGMRRRTLRVLFKRMPCAYVECRLLGKRVSDFCRARLGKLRIKN